MSRPWLLLLSAIVLASVTANTRAQGPAMAALTLAMDGGGSDPAVKPGDDFFAYANAEWLASTRIPPGKPRWGARNEIADLTAQQVSQIIREANKGKVADFYAAYIDEPAIEKRGLAPIAPLLKSIDAIADKTDLARWLGAHMRADVDPINLGVYDSAHVFGLAVSSGIHGEPKYVAYLVQGGLGMGEREAYLDEAAEKRAARAQYRDHIARTLERAGLDKAKQRADAVLALETGIARAHAIAAESDNERNADNRWERLEFGRRAPGMQWTAFFAAAGLAREMHIVAWQASAIRGTAALVASEPLPAWKDYLRFHVMERCADVLPRVNGEPARGSREERAVAATNQALPEAVGRLYVQRYFPPASKARAQAILDHVVAAFTRRVEHASWMGEPTKTVALAKLKAMYFGVGYPERWNDEAELGPGLRRGDPVGNLQRVDEWRYRNALAKLGKPVDRREWVIAPQMPGAVLNFHLDSYNFAAALLQPPKFDPAAPDAANYGAIGAIFAHEASHFVDTLGADYDSQGATLAWWSQEDKARYAAATRPLVDQFSSYRPFPDLAIDGKQTLVENLADLGGLAAAFDAYREAVGKNAADANELRQWDREFFIGFARSWRAKVTDDAIRMQVKGDGHAPESYRIATVRNLDAWYDAFDVRPGERLYLEPGARVKVW
jgi:predicted metalloendopeptidase